MRMGIASRRAFANAPRSERAWVPLVLVCVLVVGLGSAQAGVWVQMPPDTDGVDTDGDGIVNNDHVYIHVAAGDGFATMADGRSLYTFGFADATGINTDAVMVEKMLGAEWPGPTIAVREGQKLYLTVTNVGMMLRPDLFDPHTIHWHGFPEAASVFDGVPDASIAINMGASLTYFYNVVEPGTYMWHCHVEALEHMQMGMLCQIYVLPKQDMLADGTDLNGFTHHTGYKYVYNDGDGSTYYDVDVPIQLGSFDPLFHDANLNVQPLPFAAMRDTYAMLNGRGYPDTTQQSPILNENGDPVQKLDSLIVAQQGQKVLLRLSSLSTTDYFTVTSLGIPMKAVGMCAKLLRGPDGKDLSFTTASLDLGGGEAWDVILDTTDIDPGTYFLYTTNLNFLANDQEDFGGMMTEIVLVGPNGEGEQLRTVSPADGETVSLATPPTFTWTFVGLRALEFQVQIALQPGDLTTGTDVLTFPGTPVAGSSYTLTSRELRTLNRLLSRNDATEFYWRVVGTDPAGGPQTVSAASQVLLPVAAAGRGGPKKAK